MITGTRKVFAFILVLAYLMAAVLYGNHFVSTGNFQNHSQEHSAFKAFACSSFVDHSNYSENSFSFSNYASFSSLKLKFSDKEDVKKSIEKVLCSFYLQLHFKSHFLILRLGHTDIVFPFHYFW